jgi:hypothetical protein
MKQKNYCKTKIIHWCSLDDDWVDCIFYKPTSKKYIDCKFLNYDDNYESICKCKEAHREIK